jgi:hypothetical protein
MRALALAVLKVLGLDEVDTGASPLLGERVCVIHVHVDGSTAHPLRIDIGTGEMDRQLIAVGERISLVMMRGTEAQLLVVGNRPRDIRDHEDRLDTDDATHAETIETRRLPPAKRRICRQDRVCAPHAFVAQRADEKLSAESPKAKRRMRVTPSHPTAPIPSEAVAGVSRLIVVSGRVVARVRLDDAPVVELVAFTGISAIEGARRLSAKTRQRSV